MFVFVYCVNYLCANLPPGTTGTIRTTRTLDYDSGTTYYDLTVVAADGGSSPRSATTRFRITLTDVNDCIPTFDSPSYTFSISEGITKGQSSSWSTL